MTALGDDATPTVPKILMPSDGIRVGKGLTDVSRSRSRSHTKSKAVHHPRRRHSLAASEGKCEHCWRRRRRARCRRSPSSVVRHATRCARMLAPQSLFEWTRLRTVHCRPLDWISSHPAHPGRVLAAPAFTDAPGQAPGPARTLTSASFPSPTCTSPGRGLSALAPADVPGLGWRSQH